jgi:mono/diheme cytochrome c family protein
MTRSDGKMWNAALFLPMVALLATAACGQNGAPEKQAEALTYYHDVQPIVQAKCSGCHNPQGIGPFPLLTADDVTSRKTLIRAAVAQKTMPPWPPADSCTTYQHDRSLSEAQIATVTGWIDQGAPLGDPATQVTGQPPTGLSRVDFSLQMPEPFTPNESPDDYRCFLINWTPAVTKYVTGLGVHPGDPHIVHHVIAFIATPDQVAKYQALDAADPGPGWTCFGGPGIGNNAQWLGAWAPGSLGADFAADTGVRVDPGSMIVLQVHYNTSSTAPAPDQTSVDVEVADTVGHPAAVVPLADPSWLEGHMNIPAGAPDTKYEFQFDITPYMADITNGVLAANQPTIVQAAAMHMHTRGTQIKGQIVHSDGTNDCLVDIPNWSFNWQGSYEFDAPKTMNPGDQIYLGCHWNNTAANQPYVNGKQVAPTNLNWGETTEDEMCLEILYLTQ